MTWLIRNIAITVGMAVGRRLWRSYKRRRAADRAVERTAVERARR